MCFFCSFDLHTVTKINKLRAVLVVDIIGKSYHWHFCVFVSKQLRFISNSFNCDYLDFRYLIFSQLDILVYKIRLQVNML